ncbi:hypothetical protein ACU1JV_15415 [Paenibacillus sp. T2-29]|uniref:hypothetical protein n=1 Tax=Paenibacillus TaxID=44249 RepID=UPI0039BD142C
MKYTKEILEDKLDATIKEILETCDIRSRLKFLKECERVYKKLSNVKEEDSKSLFLLNIELSRLKVKFSSSPELETTDLFSKFYLIILLFAFTFIWASGNDFFTMFKTFMIYLSVSVSGAILFIITSIFKDINEISNKLILAVIIAFVFISVLFINTDKPFDMANKNVIVFVLGYSSELITTIMNKLIKKIEAVFK